MITTPFTPALPVPEAGTLRRAEGSPRSPTLVVATFDGAAANYRVNARHLFELHIRESSA